jgi:hypothetical protein
MLNLRNVFQLVIDLTFPCILSVFDRLANHCLYAFISFSVSPTYFRNHHHQMHYVEAMSANLPIGSGITEAACKVIIKARLCCSDMKWKDKGASVVLSLRALSYNNSR